MRKAADSKDTPMMKQYFEMKALHPDAVILYRVGDFYETFCDDARQVHDILGITLTSRAGNPLAGFPFHALDTYLPRLVRAGKRVAICEQLEDPKLTKKLVKRGITEFVTPGLNMGDNVLQARENNFLAAVAIGDGQDTALRRKGPQAGLALLDISTGEFMAAEGSYDYVDKLVANYAPKEMIYVKGQKALYQEHFTSMPYCYEVDDFYFSYDNARRALLAQFRTQSLKGFGIEEMRRATAAAGAILRYLEATQHNQTAHITTLRRIDSEAYMRLDKFTVRSLELVESMNEGGRSLLSVIDDTLTPMGARLLHRWVLFPLVHAPSIVERLDVVEHFFRSPELAERLGGYLAELGDVERTVGKVSVGRINPREVVQLRQALIAMEAIRALCLESGQTHLCAIGGQIGTCQQMAERIGRELVAEPPVMLGKGQVISEGVNAELDELRRIAYRGKDYLVAMQRRLSDETGITSLKVAYNSVFGYYIEVRNTHRDKVPEDWVRKQTLVGAERYITQELKEYEEKILTAEERIASLEQRIYQDLLHALVGYIPTMQVDAQLMARLDCLLSMSRISARYRYIRPDVDDSLVIDIRQGRHPVIERQMPAGEAYVPNDVCLLSGEVSDESACAAGDGGAAGMAQGAAAAAASQSAPGPDGTAGAGQAPGAGGAEQGQHTGRGRQPKDFPQIMMITGPNMAGKSALLRQTALITLMAHIGCFVPAESAHIGIVDKIFTRVGASDNISLGESTFMVEMTEAANILNNLSPRSLVLFDELGRGTSTYDGISIAWAIVEHIHERAAGRPKMLFATHYHELNEMERSYPRIHNYNVSVREEQGKVLFLRTLRRGGSEHSFGIHVARLAGMLPEVVERADAVLHMLEQGAVSVQGAGLEASDGRQDPSAGGQAARSGRRDAASEGQGTPAGRRGASGASRSAAAAMQGLHARTTGSDPVHREPGYQYTIFQLDDPVLSQIRDEIRELDPDRMTPMQALAKLDEIKRICGL